MEIDKIKRVVLNSASEKEKLEVEAWMRESRERRLFVEKAELFYKGKGPGEEELKMRVEKMWKAMGGVSGKRRTMVWKAWAAAVACILFVVGNVFWNQRMWKERESGKAWEKGDSEEVQLILPDGSRHEMTAVAMQADHITGFGLKGQSIIQQKVDRTDAFVPEYLEIIVPEGKERSLILADGTNVKLNSGTRMRFPASFSPKERKVFLSGEAYFDVAREEARPFRVEFLGGEVEVLGTQFDVKAYLEENCYATLVSGKVKVTSGCDSVVLRPGELCEIAVEEHSLSVREADLISVLAWKNGDFVFKGVSLKQIIDELARWYNAEVEYRSLKRQGIKLHVYMDRPRTMEEAMEIIAGIGGIKYKTEGKKIIIEEQ